MARYSPFGGRNAGLGLVGLILCGALTGCGWRRAEVRGTVRYNGRPVTAGTIQFLGRNGVPCAGTIGPDGTYAVRVPPGPAKVIVSRPASVPGGRLEGQSGGRIAPPASADTAEASGLPQRYADWGASGLTVQVKPRTTAQDFDLTD
jgi:hypothetical protein